MNFMDKLTKNPFKIFIGALFLALIAFFVFLKFGNDSRKDDVVRVLKQVESPQKESIATIFVFHSGGLNSFPVTFVNLRRRGDKFTPINYALPFFGNLSDNDANVFEELGELVQTEVTWKNENSVAVSLPKSLSKGEIFTKKDKWEDVSIAYEW